MKKTFFLVSIFLLTQLTCTKDIYSPNACFTENVLPIFISNCTFSGCHNSTDKKAGYSLATYEGIMKGITAKHPLKSEVYNSISGKNASMPQQPYTKLSKKDVYTIKTWIQMGAKNSSNCVICDSLDFTFSKRVLPVLQTWCVGCHNAGNPGGGFDLSNYTGIVTSITTNKLLGSVKHLPSFSAMPKNGSQLSTCDIKAIEKWLNAGYPNN